MNKKIIGMAIAIVIAIGVIIFVTSQQEKNQQISLTQNSTLPIPQGRHLQVSLSESVGVKTK